MEASTLGYLIRTLDLEGDPAAQLPDIQKSVREFLVGIRYPGSPDIRHTLYTINSMARTPDANYPKVISWYGDL